MLRKVYIRHREQYPENENLFAALEGFRKLGVETAPFYGFGDIAGLDDLGREVGLCGYVGDVLEALATCGARKPEPLDYPDSLAVFTDRSIYEDTLGAVRARGQRCFIKPLQHKLFTGTIWSPEDASARRAVVTIESATAVWVADVLEDILSEWRIFVLDREIVGAKHYKGDWSKAPDREEIESAVRNYRDQPAAYSLDFSARGNGQTTLIEANDSFALGTYGLECTTYAKMISARWEQLTR